jgi:hypothetical protein
MDKLLDLEKEEDKMSVTDKIERFLKETVYAADFPQNTSKYTGQRPIQFMKFWANYRPGDRINVNFLDDAIEMFGTNAEGQFAGSKAEKEFEILDPEEMDTFKSSEGDIWNFV